MPSTSWQTAINIIQHTSLTLLPQNEIALQYIMNFSILLQHPLGTPRCLGKSSSGKVLYNHLLEKVIVTFAFAWSLHFSHLYQPCYGALVIGLTFLSPCNSVPESHLKSTIFCFPSIRKMLTVCQAITSMSTVPFDISNLSQAKQHMFNGEQMGQRSGEDLTGMAWVTILATPPAWFSTSVYPHSHWGYLGRNWEILPSSGRQKTSPFWYIVTPYFFHIVTTLKKTAETFLIIGRCEIINIICSEKCINKWSVSFSCTTWKYDSTTVWASTAWKKGPHS